MKLILFLITLFFLFASLWGFYVSIRPSKILSTITPMDLGLSYESVSFQTKDGLTLSGWFIPSKAPSVVDSKTIVLLHGYPADKGDILLSLIFLNDQYNLFLFDFRYLGSSQGSYSTVGAMEINDLVSAIEYLKTRGINEVGVWGFSMGGAVALMSVSQIPEIKAIASEASYASLSLMARELYRIPLLNYPLAWLTGLWAKIFIGVDISKISVSDRVKDTTIPIMIIHSKNDDVTPFKNAMLLEEALKHNPNAVFWFQDDLIHGQFDTEYQKKITDFFLKNL